MFENVKDFAKSVVSPSSGSYAVFNAKMPAAWYACREQFHPYTNELQEMLFCHTKNKGKDIAYFISEFESKLNHKNKTECGPTKHNLVMWIRPATFWQKLPLRRSLFTALLRAGLKYDHEKQNFESALFSQKYIKQTKKAVLRFLDGYTWCSEKTSNQQWHNTFYPMKKEEIEKTLIKKPIKNSSLLQFAIDKLGVTYEQLEDEYRKNFYTHAAKENKIEIPKLKVMG